MVLDGIPRSLRRLTNALRAGRPTRGRMRSSALAAPEFATAAKSSSSRRKSISVSFCVPVFPLVTSHLRYAETDNPVIAAAPLIRTSSTSDKRTLTTLLTGSLRKESCRLPHPRRFPITLNIERRGLDGFPADSRREFVPGVRVYRRLVACAADRHVVQILSRRQAPSIQIDHHPVGRQPLGAVHGRRVGVFEVKGAATVQLDAPSFLVLEPDAFRADVEHPHAIPVRDVQSG